jgi:hypothetical protein
MAVRSRSFSADVAAPRARRDARALGGGTEGNGRLTAATGVVLVVLLAVIGVTILRLRPLIWVHLFVGMLLIGPVVLKMASTAYRFVRYYTRNTAYRVKGPPELALRLIAPIVVLTTVIVFASGVALLLVGPSSRAALLPVHKISFIVWVVFTALHVLGHLPRLPRELSADFGPRRLTSDVTGRSGRILALAGAIVAGAVLGVVTIPEFGPWVHSMAAFHGGH